MGGGTTLYSNTPIGSIIPYAANNDLPDGYLVCNGAEVLISEYTDLYLKIRNTFGVASDNDHFVLPDLRDKFIEGSNTAGTDIEAGLPNIKGKIKTSSSHWLMNISGGTSDTVEGALSIELGTSVKDFTGNSSSTGDFAKTISFDASLSNSIYDDDIDTVQPPSLTMIYIIKALDVAEILLEEEEIPEENYTIIYPNNGTEENPANVTTATEYILPNPFPGYVVQCQAELYYNNEWGIADLEGWANSQGYWGEGVVAKQHNDGSIKLITGSHTLLNLYSQYQKSIAPNTFTNTTESGVTSIPCRIKVWKVNSINKTPIIKNQVNIGSNYEEGEDWCYIYPNNGTAENPANVTKTSSYIMNNPFPGYLVKCEAELLFNNEWGVTTFNMAYVNSNYIAFGISAAQHDSDKISITTGSHTLINGNAKYKICGYTWNVNSSSYDGNQDTLPCRVKVWKIGKIPTT